MAKPLADKILCLGSVGWSLEFSCPHLQGGKAFLSDSFFCFQSLAFLWLPNEVKPRGGMGRGGIWNRIVGSLSSRVGSGHENSASWRSVSMKGNWVCLKLVDELQEWRFLPPPGLQRQSSGRSSSLLLSMGSRHTSHKSFVVVQLECQQGNSKSPCNLSAGRVHMYARRDWVENDLTLLILPPALSLGASSSASPFLFQMIYFKTSYKSKPMLNCLFIKYTKYYTIGAH